MFQGIVYSVMYNHGILACVLFICVCDREREREGKKKYVTFSCNFPQYTISGIITYKMCKVDKGNHVVHIR